MPDNTLLLVSALIPTLSYSIPFQPLWLSEATSVHTTLQCIHQTLFSNCMLPLHHFQTPRVLYYSLPHIPTFIASSSISHIQNSTFFTLPHLPPMCQQACSPHFSFLPCRSAGISIETVAAGSSADVCGNWQLPYLRGKITDSGIFCWRIKNFHASAAPQQWPWSALFPHGKPEMVCLFVTAYHIYSRVGMCPWAVTRIDFLHMSTQLAVLSSQIIMHLMTV